MRVCAAFGNYISALIRRGFTDEARRVLCRALNQQCYPESPYIQELPHG